MFKCAVFDIKLIYTGNHQIFFQDVQLHATKLPFGGESVGGRSDWVGGLLRTVS